MVFDSMLIQYSMVFDYMVLKWMCYKIFVLCYQFNPLRVTFNTHRIDF